MTGLEDKIRDLTETCTNGNTQTRNTRMGKFNKSRNFKSTSYTASITATVQGERMNVFLNLGDVNTSTTVILYLS